ncbi:MAG: hypothetical protein H6706_25595 [Myxococcales bacterium]|nr:hypothetical protein [Myxococcales bacterium]
MRPSQLLCAATLLAASPANAAGAGDAIALPVGGILAAGVIGGLGTTLILAVSDGEVHPALRNIGLGCAAINVTAGTAGLIASRYLDDDDPKTLVTIGASTVLAIGLAGGLLSLLADTYTPAGNAQVTPLPGGLAASWHATF